MERMNNFLTIMGRRAIKDEYICFIGRGMFDLTVEVRGICLGGELILCYASAKNQNSKMKNKFANMKKYIIIVTSLLMTISLFAQIQTENYQNGLNQRIENCIRTYRLFPTINVQYFIKLNTRTGQMWQIEFDEKETNQSEIPLNSLSLVEKQKEVDNRFTLYPTENPWTFLLLDQMNGKIWQAQWDMKPKKTEILALNSLPLIEEQKEVDNRFTLYSTQNSWNFLLLDKINGKIWQVRWSMKSEKGEIIPIQ